MNLSVLLTATEQGLIYSLVALGLYLSFRVLNIADLTTDGSFTLGLVTCTACTAAGHPYLGLLLAVAAGALAGFVTGILQTVFRVQPILAGIITMTALVSINIMVLGGKSNQTLLRVETLFTAAQKLLGNQGGLCVAAAAALLCGVLLVLFLGTQLGLSLRATGDNRHPPSIRPLPLWWGFVWQTASSRCRARCWHSSRVMVTPHWEPVWS